MAKAKEQAFCELLNSRYILFLQFRAILGNDSDHRHIKTLLTTVLWFLAQSLFVKNFCLTRHSAVTPMFPWFVRLWGFAVWLEWWEATPHILVHEIKYCTHVACGYHLSRSYHIYFLLRFRFQCWGLNPGSSTCTLGRCCSSEQYLWPSFYLSL